jgi:hypothetical protein
MCLPRPEIVAFLPQLVRVLAPVPVRPLPLQQENDQRAAIGAAAQHAVAGKRQKIVSASRENVGFSRSPSAHNSVFRRCAFLCLQHIMLSSSPCSCTRQCVGRACECTRSRARARRTRPLVAARGCAANTHVHCGPECAAHVPAAAAAAPHVFCSSAVQSSGPQRLLERP